MRSLAAAGGRFAVVVALTLLGLLAVTFFIGRVIPVDPVLAIVGDRAPEHVIERVRIEMGLDRPLYEQFYTKVTGKTGAQVKAAWSRLVFSGKGTPPKELGSSAEVKKFVAANADGIGYIEKSALDGSVKAVLTVD